MSDAVLPSTPESPGEMFVSPLESAGPSRRVTAMASPRVSGVSRLMKTPKQRRTQSADLSGLNGVRQLMKTPKVQKSPALEGVKKLVSTPKDVADTPELDGIRNLVKTPKPGRSPGLAGVKQLLKTPKAQKSPALDGVKKLLRTPKDVALSPKLDGVRKLVKTPKAQKSPRLSGMKKLLKTPKTKKSPQLAGLKTLMRTPQEQLSPIFAGVRQLMKTPKSGPKSPDFGGVSEMLASPQTSGAVFLERSTQKSVPKKKRGKEASVSISAVPSPRAPETKGRKIREKTAARVEVEGESSSVSRRGASRSKSAADMVDMQEKGKKKPEAAVVAGRRKGKHDESLEIVENSKGKTPSHGWKHPQTVEPVEAPVSKSRRRAQEMVVVEHPMTKATKSKQRGKSSTSDLPEPVVQLDRVKTGVKSSPVKKSSRGKVNRKLSVEVVETAANTSKKSERVEVEGESSSVSRRASSRSKSADYDMVVSKKQKMRKPVAETEVAESRAEVGVVFLARSPKRSTSRRGKSRVGSEDASGASTKAVAAYKKTDVTVSKDKVTKASTPAKPRSKRQFVHDRSPAGHREKTVASKQVESAKAPISTRRGKRQVTVKESHPAVANAKMQEKGKKQPEAAVVASRRKGKHDESLEIVENIKGKTPSRGRKRPQTVEPVEAPVSKSRRHAQEMVVVEQPMTKATKSKQRGKSSTSDLPEPVVQLDSAKTGVKLSPVKKSSRGKVNSKLSVKVVETAANTSKKSGNKSAKKPKGADDLLNMKLKGSERKKIGAKMVAEIEKKAVVSPLATRSKRTKH